jgi:hypothetical protein
MSPLRQQLLDAIAKVPDTDLEAMLHFIQSRQTPASISTPQQAWDQVIDRLNTLTPEDRILQHQATTELLQSWNNEPDPDEPEESWESLKTALDQNRNSYRPLFPMVKAC